MAKDETIFYHGSPNRGLSILHPQFDSRLGITGVFFSHEPFGPMVYSLLLLRAEFTVNYKTDKM